MIKSFTFLLVFAHFTSLWVPAHAAEDVYQAPISLEKLHISVKVDKRGTFSQVKEKTTRLETPYAASRLGHHIYSYIASQETLMVLDAYTLTPAGKKIKLSKSWIKKHNAKDNANDINDFNDVKIIFPEVSKGSRLYSKVLLKRFKPNNPGEFKISLAASPSVPYEDVKIDLTAPADMKLYASSRGFEGGLISAGKQPTHYAYHLSQMQAFREEDNSQDDFDFAPYVTISTFPDYVAVGDSYERVAHQRAKVTPELRQLALQLTAGLSTEEEKAHALYNWVTKNIRYVATSIGPGRLQPHPASEVYRHRFGDCKDHVVLLEALLHAVGIPSSAALINSGESFEFIASPGDYSPMNHVITYLPNLDLYLDSTAQFAPFGILSNSVLDKPTVLTALGRLGRTPKMQTSDHKIETEVRMLMHQDGSIEGQSIARMNGDRAINSRANRYAVDIDGQEKNIIELFYRFNEIGDGSISSTPPSELDQPFVVRTSFTLDRITDLSRPGGFALPVGLAPAVIASQTTFKPIASRRFPYVCNSHLDQDDYQLTLPAGIEITQLPQDRDYDDGEIRYTSRYAVKDGSIQVQRRLQVQYPKRVCPPEAHERWKRFVELMREDVRGLVMYR